MEQITLKEKMQKAISDSYTLNKAIEMIEDALCLEDIKRGIRLIPDKVILRISAELISFRLHDITRKDLVKVLKKQLVSLKRSARRYIKLYEKEENQ